MFLKVNKTFLKTKVFIMEILDQNMRPDNKMHKKGAIHLTNAAGFLKNPQLRVLFILVFSRVFSLLSFKSLSFYL